MNEGAREGGGEKERKEADTAAFLTVPYVYSSLNNGADVAIWLLVTAKKCCRKKLHNRDGTSNFFRIIMSVWESQVFQEGDLSQHSAENPP